MALPDPYNNAGLIQQGFGEIGKGLQQGAENARLDSPGDPMWDAWFNRLLAGEDPDKLAEEAKRPGGHLDMLLNKIKNQGNPQNVGAQIVPDVGFKGGIPQVQPSGAVDPNRGPGAPGLTGFGFGGRVAPQGGGLTDPQALQPAPANNVGPQDMQLGGRQVQGVNGMDAMVLQSKPMAPTMNSQSAFDGAQPGAKPQPDQVPRAQAQAGGASVGKTPGRTVRQQQAMMPMATQMAAAQSRVDVARIAADQKRDTANAALEARSLIALMRENGMDDRAMEEIYGRLQGLSTKEQIAAMQVAASLLRAQMMAGAAVKVAGMKGEQGDDQTALKTLSAQITATESAIAQYAKSDRTLMPDGTYMTREQAQARLKQLKAEYDRRIGMQKQAGGGGQYGGMVQPGMTTPVGEE